MTDPGRNGGEGTGRYHRHPSLEVCETFACIYPGTTDGAPVIVLDPVTARDTIARALGDMNVSGWLVYPHPNTGEPMQEEVPLGYIAEGVIAALVREAGR